MGGVDEEEEDGDEEGAGRMEDVFGADAGGDTKMDED
jgi:transcription initiation factor TFIID subunit 9B